MTERTSRRRALTLAIALWAFGLCTSTLLIGLWGRSVATDRHTLEDATRSVLASGIVHDRIEDWITTGLTAAGAQAGGDVAGAVEAVMDTPVMRDVIDDLVDQAAAGALAPPDAPAAVDLSRSVEVAAPVVASALADRGVAVDEGALSALAGDLVLWSEEQGVVGRAARRAGGILTRVVVVGGIGLAVTGAAAVAASEDRMAQVRGLLTRVAVSAFTFAIILRVGAWAVDPRGGRSPVASGTSQVLGSNLHVPAMVGVAATAAVVASLAIRRRKARVPGTRGEGDDTQAVDPGTPGSGS